MKLPIAGSDKATFDVSETVFACEFNEPLIHQVVTAYLSAGRAGTHAQKNRAAVRGGGAKPFAQKGGGRARAGTIRSPLWRKGGVVFAAQPRSYAQKVNKKMYRGAVRSILSELIRQDRLLVVDTFTLEIPKTKAMLAKLNDMQVGTNVLIIIEAVDEALYLAARNVPYLDVRDLNTVDPVALIGSEKVIITKAALKQYEELLA